MVRHVGQTASRAQGSHGTGAGLLSGPMSSEGAVDDIKHVTANNNYITIHLLRNATDI